MKLTNPVITKFTDLSDVPHSYVGSANKFTKVNASETGMEFATGGGGVPAGLDMQVQFNDSGSFGGSSAFLFDKTSNAITLGIENNVGSIGAPNATTANTYGSALFLNSGDGKGSGGGGDIHITSGNGNLTDGINAGGAVNFYSGSGGIISGDGGAMAFVAGNSVTTGNGGTFQMFGGNGALNGDGGFFNLISGNSGSGSGNGGAFTIKAGNAVANGNGGNIIIVAGNTLTGSIGNIKLENPVNNIDAIIDLSFLTTSDKTFTFQNKTGTLALTSDLSSIVLFDHYTNAGNVTTGETDLYSDTIAAGQLASNGEKLEAEYGGVFISSGTATRQVKLYFGGTVIFDSGTLTLSLSSAWTMYTVIIRVSASVIRYMISFTTEGAALSAYTSVGELTGLTLSNTNILKVTGQAAGVGAATNDIVAKLGSVEWRKAA